MTPAADHAVDVPAGRPAARTWLAAGTVVVALVAIAMRRALRATNADSLLSGLISTQHLTAYYWGQDRLANIVPAIAWPIRDVRWNHLFQTAVLAASFFVLLGSFVWLHASRMRRRPQPGVLVAALAVTGGLALVLLDRSATYVLVLEQQYAFSTVLFLTGLWWSTRSGPRSWVVGGVAMVAGLVVIPSSVLLLPAVVLLRPGLREWRAWARVAATAGAAFVVATAASKLLAPDYPAAGAYTSFSVGRMRDGFSSAASNIGHSVHIVPAIVIGAACVAVLAVRRPQFDRSLWWGYVACPFVALAWVALFSANEWVEINVFHHRYFFVAYAAGLLVLAGAVTEVCAQVAARIPDAARTPVPMAASALIAAAVAAASVMVVERTTIPAADEGAALAAEADTVGADVVVGDYWRAWPAVFADRAAGGDLLAAAPRSEALRSEFVERDRTDGAIDALCLDADVPACITGLNVGTESLWEVVEVRSTTPLVIRVTLVP